MGLRDELTADLAEAFDGDLADAVTSFTAEHQGEQQYNPNLGSVEAVKIDYSGRGVIGGYKAEEIDGTLTLATDKKLIALQAEVTRAPAVGDKLDGMRVISVGQDPAAATWQVQLRI